MVQHAHLFGGHRPHAHAELLHLARDLERAVAELVRIRMPSENKMPPYIAFQSPRPAPCWIAGSGNSRRSCSSSVGAFALAPIGHQVLRIREVVHQRRDVALAEQLERLDQLREALVAGRSKTMLCVPIDAGTSAAERLDRLDQVELQPAQLLQHEAHRGCRQSPRPSASLSGRKRLELLREAEAGDVESEVDRALAVLRA